MPYNACYEIPLPDNIHELIDLSEEGLHGLVNDDEPLDDILGPDVCFDGIHLDNTDEVTEFDFDSDEVEPAETTLDRTRNATEEPEQDSVISDVEDEDAEAATEQSESEPEEENEAPRRSGRNRQLPHRYRAPARKV